MLGALEVLPFEHWRQMLPTDCCATSGLRRAGRPIGANDLLIAAQALSLGYTVTG